MRELGFGEDLPTKENLYASVKKKGDSITFRIAKKPVYTGKHFEKTESGWNVTNCPRINYPDGDQSCDLCERYFEIMKLAKEAEESDPKAHKELKKEARKYQVSIQFYFPVLNRDLKIFQVLRTTYGVRNKLNEQHLAGVDVMASDWILSNTGSDSPRDLYSLVRKDSADVEPFDEKEKVEFKKAQEFDTSKITDSVKSGDEDDDDRDDPELKDVKDIFEDK